MAYFARFAVAYEARSGRVEMTYVADLVARLLAVDWQDARRAERHAESRKYLMAEFLRRNALWAKAVAIAKSMIPLESDFIHLQTIDHWRTRRPFVVDFRDEALDRIDQGFEPER